MNGETMILSVELANEILGYLGKRPYDEVFQLIEKLQGEYRNNLATKAAESADDGST